MRMVPELEALTAKLAETIAVAQQYRDRIATDVESARAGKESSERVLHIWNWQLEAATNLVQALDEDAWNDVQRIVEQDFILRQPNVGEILI